MKTEAVKTNDLYSTNDLVTAVTLSLFFPIDAIDKTDKHRVVFYFRRVDNFDATLERFWRKQLFVEPMDFANQLKSIKTRIYWEK